MNERLLKDCETLETYLDACARSTKPTAEDNWFRRMANLAGQLPEDFDAMKETLRDVIASVKPQDKKTMKAIIKAKSMLHYLETGEREGFMAEQIL